MFFNPYSPGFTTPLTNACRLLFSHNDSGVSKADEMQQRLVHLRTACTTFPESRAHLANMKAGPVYFLSRRHHLGYCRVAKAGSTFWAQIFLTLEGADATRDEGAFGLTRDEVHAAVRRHPDISVNYTDPELLEATSFLVARDPYSRLFSAYIDQFYLPNKWHFSKFISRDDACGSNISFRQFINFASAMIIKKMAYSDPHYAPIFTLCMPCESNVNFVAKHETFNDDTDFILNHADIDDTIRKEINLAIQQHSTIDRSLESLVETYVSKAHKASIRSGCITEKEIAHRIWHAFQIQGYIHNDDVFPSELFENIKEQETSATLKSAVHEVAAHRKWGDRERAAQRRTWMTSFWRSMDADLLARVQDAYYEDFIMFGYDLTPDFLHDTQ